MAAHGQTYIAQCDEEGRALPRFVNDEFDAYLKCGILAHGFSLHAGVRCAAHDRQGIEQLCRYITRPAISNKRMSINSKGQVVIKLKTPWKDGATHIVLEPLEFMQRLAALVPRPRLHLTSAPVRMS